jgi:hypothetical protein
VTSFQAAMILFLCVIVLFLIRLSIQSIICSLSVVLGGSNPLQPLLACLYRIVANMITIAAKQNPIAKSFLLVPDVSSALIQRGLTMDGSISGGASMPETVRTDAATFPMKNGARQDPPPMSAEAETEVSLTQPEKLFGFLPNCPRTVRQCDVSWPESQSPFE